MKRPHLFILSLSLCVIGLLLSACAVTLPLGENGKYGEVYAGYRPPAYPLVDVSDPPLFREK